MLAASRRPTISSRPLGVRRAFLCTVALSPGKETDVSQHQLPPTSGREQPSENSHLGAVPAATWVRDARRCLTEHAARRPAALDGEPAALVSAGNAPYISRWAGQP